MLSIPKVNIEVWRGLYAASMAFREAAPWLRLMDSQPFAVIHPDHQEMGYGCIMGAVGKLRALGLYRGNRGLASYVDILQQEASSHPDDFAGSQDCLMAEWTDREFVTPEDRRVMKALGLKFKGPARWPVFRSYIPRYAPWYLTEEEARFLTLGLRAAVDIDRRVRAGLKLPESPGRLFTLKMDSSEFSGEWRDFIPPAPPIAERFLIDPVKIQALRENRAKRVEAWEADVLNQPILIEDRDRPYFLRSAMAADKTSGLILQFKTVCPDEADGRILADMLLDLMIEQQSIPVAVEVRQDLLAASLEPLSRELDIRISMKKHLPAIALARDSFEEFQSGGGSETSAAEALDDGELQQTPRMDRRAMEGLTADIFRAVQESGASSQEELDAIVRDFNRGERQAPAPRTPIEAAQKMMYEAWDAQDSDARIALAKRALKLSPDCADAYVLLAEENAPSKEEARALYQKGMEAGERALGGDFFRENVGRFWGMIESRPYMRAREGLARMLFRLNRKEEAFAHWRELLRLNPNDNQGIRFVLSAELANEQRWKELAELMDSSYPDDATAEWLYAKALLRFVQAGDAPPARQALRRAIAQNRYVPAYLTGEKSFPNQQPESLTLGGEDEGCATADLLLKAWRQTPKALDWLRAQTLDGRTTAKAGRNDPCPCGSGKKYKKCCAA